MLSTTAARYAHGPRVRVADTREVEPLVEQLRYHCPFEVRLAQREQIEGRSVAGLHVPARVAEHDGIARFLEQSAVLELPPAQRLRPLPNELLQLAGLLLEPVSSEERRPSPSMVRMRALRNTFSVRMRAWWPRSERAGTPSSLS